MTSRLLASILAASTLVALPAVAGEAPAAPVAAATQANPQAAAALVARVLPARAGEFAIEIIPAADGKDVFEVESANGKIVLRGNNGVSVASALNWYLKEICHAQLSWCGDQLNLPAQLPPVPAKIRTICLHKYRVMFNYCTLSYTCSWWDWERWQRELDFLAMNGINMPLGVIGLEGVWYNTLTKHGFSDQEAREFLVGPTYFAWQWMTNIEGQGGPLPKSWIDSHVEMGQKWMARARELGMTPIQQGFSGNVPRLLKKKHPEAAIAQQPSWAGFHGSAQLDPTDPLFKQLGKTFMEENIKLFGNGHVWAADPFHESAPPKPGAEYLEAVGKSIYSLMKEVDPQAMWAMQAWSIRKEIACAVPKGELLVLDLGGGRNDFWGHNFVKGQLHNFGGRINLHGDLRDVTGNRFADAAKKMPTCVGMGLFPEAIIQNPVFYDCVYDMIWRDQPADIDAWLRGYAQRRYGAASAKAAQAWTILLNDGPYRRGTSGVESSSMIAARPALVVKKSGPNAGFRVPYPPLKLVEATELLLQESEKLGQADTYRYDLVDFTRQILSNLTQIVQKDIRTAYQNKDKAAYDKAVAEFDGILADVDRLLASRTEFLYGKWLANASRWGTTPEEKAQYAWNAAMLVTIWGPSDETDGKKVQIFDYSWREWSGLINNFYRPRWQQFHGFLAQSIDKGDYIDPTQQVYGREAFRSSPFYSKLADWEMAFIKQPLDLPATPQGDSVAIVRELLTKYHDRLIAAYPADQAVPAKPAVKIPGKVIGGWKANEITPAGKELMLDITKQVQDEGEYEITFTYTGGSKRLDIKSVALYVNGNEVMRDTHPGATGNEHIRNTYTVKVAELVFNGKYEIRAQVRTDGGDSSIGTISMQKKGSRQ